MEVCALKRLRERKIAKILRIMAGRRCEGIREKCMCFADCECKPCGNCVTCEARTIRRSK